MTALLLAASVLLAAAPGPVTGEKAQPLIEQAGLEWKTNRPGALSHLSRAIEIDSKNQRAWFLRGYLRELDRDFSNAIADYSRAIALDSTAPAVFQQRGGANFKAGRMREAIADFDAVVRLAPELEAHLWQRGIAYYYAGEFEKGAKQFELHQTVNPNDVENAVWHQLCLARTAATPNARAKLLPIRSDSRVPMMEVYALFRGDGSETAVLDAAKSAGKASNSPDFFAHLYLGLYFETRRDETRARSHILEAVRLASAGDYMGEVARVHAALRWGKRAG